MNDAGKKTARLEISDSIHNSGDGDEGQARGIREKEGIVKKGKGITD